MIRSIMVSKLTAAVLSALILLACGEDGGRPAGPGGNDTADSGQFREYSYSIVNTFSHSLDAYTQGLVFEEGFLYESTGLHGESSVRKVELETGNILMRHDLATRHFGEGITISGDSIIQLTLTSGEGFIYTREELDSIGRFEYDFFPWGLTDDGKKLIVSDGSDTLYFLSPDTFLETGRITVRHDSAAVDQLNELEYIEGKVFANVYGSYNIMIIDPASGRVTGRVDLSGIRDGSVPAPGAGIPNGIAYDPVDKRIFVTGKNWPDLFEIELIPAGN
ncbi:MAG: glutaminyl-peptide cyclotransferase [Candidatus Latescibacteria bacterium]|nr:glutaminyl-peptide cyclotransferase [bacterium]MBD3425182.1 glutaminyl-peptide cyclotransferase [Candidatus Latescibacterota bacterium]